MTAGKKKRWTAGRKKEAVLRLLRGEEVDALSRELGATISELEEWRQIVLERMEVLLKAQKEDPLYKPLQEAKKRIGELCMENELLKEKDKKRGVFWGGKW